MTDDPTAHTGPLPDVGDTVRDTGRGHVGVVTGRRAPTYDSGRSAEARSGRRHRSTSSR